MKKNALLFGIVYLYIVTVRVGSFKTLWKQKHLFVSVKSKDERFYSPNETSTFATLRLVSETFTAVCHYVFYSYKYDILCIKDSRNRSYSRLCRCVTGSQNVCSSSETLTADFTRLTALFGLNGFPGEKFFIFIHCFHSTHTSIPSRSRRRDRTHVWLILWRELHFSPSIHDDIRVILIHNPFCFINNEFKFFI